MPWWDEAVVYQVYPRSFADGNGDGEGDFPGLRARLPYLAELGVDAIWLNPFYPSPMADGGYDVSDHRGVDPRFGTISDFDDLVSDAASYGMRILVDIVPNHCSAAHPWFQAALESAPGGPERGRFIFRDGIGDAPPNNWQSFFGGPAWTRVRDGQWYLHLFDSAQPDFDWRHPEVPALFEETLRFWLDRGAGGIRIDVANALFKAENLPDLPPGMLPDDPSAPYSGRPELFRVYRTWREILDSYPGDRVAVLEMWSEEREHLRPYLADGQLHQLFNFTLMTTPWRAADLRASVELSRSLTSGSHVRAPWVLENHDAPRLATRLGVDQELIRNPTEEALRGEVDVDHSLGRRRARAAALLLLALPGSAYLYQGQELGLFEVLDIPADRRDDPIYTRTGGAVFGRDGCRVPLPWSGESAPYGFGTGEPWLPQPADWAAGTVEAQSADPASTLSLYRAALRLRRDHPALGAGDLAWTDAGEQTVTFTRDPGFLFVLNTGAEPVELPPGKVLLGSAPLDGGLLPADTAVWMEC
ncbi:glycoside hydrolase family 13 protein [Streptosporangium sp. CA-135522]|uniref:glycoside hydrolase family 13 protein n=1 Tax=Streptosporangium sp. CA-135522 TaxID=3240072 RepID=UPI003D8F0EFA